MEVDDGISWQFTCLATSETLHKMQVTKPPGIEFQIFFFLSPGHSNIKKYNKIEEINSNIMHHIAKHISRILKPSLPIFI